MPGSERPRSAVDQFVPPKTAMPRDGDDETIVRDCYRSTVRFSGEDLTLDAVKRDGSVTGFAYSTFIGYKYHPGYLRIQFGTMGGTYVVIEGRNLEELRRLVSLQKAARIEERMDNSAEGEPHIYGITFNPVGDGDDDRELEEAA